jgi:CubicO group peptidase (beta-lactamase class C family)
MNRRFFLGLPLLAYAKPQDLRQRIPEWMRQHSVPGLWVTTIEGGKIVMAEGFGVRNASDAKQPIDADTIFEAASLTKQVTAHVAHALAKEGKLDFDKPLHDYVPALTDPLSKTVTARHVMSHSSGWPNWRNEKDEQLVPQFAPGSKYRYSGEGYVYLARVLEQVADMGFGELVQKRVFDPFEMTSSALFWIPDRGERMALGHDRKGVLRDARMGRKLWGLAATTMSKPIARWRYADSEELLAKAGLPPLPNMIVPNAASSMYTTGPDYAKFVLNAIKNPELRKQYTTIREGLGWGLGWAIEQTEGRQFLWQWGNNGGYKNFVMMDPVAESGVFVFTNGDSGQKVCDRVVVEATGMKHPALSWLS